MTSLFKTRTWKSEKELRAMLRHVHWRQNVYSMISILIALVFCLFTFTNGSATKRSQWVLVAIWLCMGAHCLSALFFSIERYRLNVKTSKENRLETLGCIEYWQEIYFYSDRMVIVQLEKTEEYSYESIEKVYKPRGAILLNVPGRYISVHMSSFELGSFPEFCQFMQEVVKQNRGEKK